MQPILFGHMGAHRPSGPNYVTPAVRAKVASDQLLQFSEGAIYGNKAQAAVTTTDAAGVTAVVIGQPKWRNASHTLAAVASELRSAYNETGERAFSNLSNGFAAVIVDSARRTVHMAIDRIGRMPLAYGLLPDGGLCFSTDARAVARAIDSNAPLNDQALYDYVFFHAVPSPQTVFKDVFKLQPASRLQWSVGKIGTATYWQPDFQVATPDSPAVLQKAFLDSLEEGVRAAAPDANTASFLSGGIDSSVVTGMLARILGRGRPAYTIGFEQAGYDETAYARISADHFGADLRVHYINTREVQQCIPELAALYDEPFGNSSAVPALVCARLAKNDGVAQMLAGDGGDELFAGNTRYAKQRIFEAYGRVPAFAQAAAEKFFLGNNPVVTKTPLRKVKSYLQQARIPLPDRLESYNFLLRENIGAMFAPAFLAGIDTQHPFGLMRAQYFQVPNASTLDRMLHLDWKFTLADNDLRKVTKTCLHAGVDVAFPWLDDGVIEFSTRLPSNQKLRGTKLRYFAKQALSEFLPHATIAKSKHGFGLPFGQWLKTSPELQNQVYELLSALSRRDIFQPQFITHLISEHRGGHAAYYGTMVWVLAMLEGWLQANTTTND